MPGEPGWLDMAIYCEGEASLTLLQVCRQLWRGLKTLPQIPQDLLEGFYEQIPTSEHTAVRVRQNDWVKRKNQIHNSYVEMFNKAEKQITIMCSYFLPHEVYRRKMSRAVKRGVKIRVILAGVSDIPIAKHAERYLYDWMLKKKIGIFEYQPTILHAKTAVYDGKWVTIGSYNLNNMSAHVSLELNLDVNDKKFAREVEKELDQIISRHCKEITYENYSQSTGFFRRLWQRVCFVMIKYSLKIFTFYFRQEE
jgi:cardiolipin synthase